MNEPRELDSSNNILYVNFNQTATAITVGAKTGYSLYDLNTVNEVIPTSSSMDTLKDVCIAERSFSTSLIAYVKLEKPRNLFLFHHLKDTIITEKSFPNTILSVKLNRQNIIVCLEDSIFIMDVQDLKDEKTHVITNTPPNPKGLIALNYGAQEQPSFLAYPGSSSIGTVQIFDTKERLAKITIPAHNGVLAALAFDGVGEKIATASIKGTVIRVFSVAKGEILFEFRRGVKRCVEISCLYFCKDPELLCVASNTETIHIFKLAVPELPQPSEEETEGWMEMFGRVLTQSAKYLPTQMSDVFTQQRAFAYVYLPFVSESTICAISYINKIPYVVVASLEGFLYIYDINMELGGSCHLVKQHKLEGPEPPDSRRSIGSLKSLKDFKKLPNDTNCDEDTTPCLEPEIVKSNSEDSHGKNVPGVHVPELYASESNHSSCNDLNVSNGVQNSCEGLPLIFNQGKP
ncbi:WD repeat domain phosphoinositide-interacting protein 2 [Trichonephila clavata]|uniref:WD repeat domain phosphoinositide-interacting protein 2 n=1 Tax=Trichonephila clavata TaxID=2740835 RepID=A0A8X6HEW8_TRICU|nr:WD repeat domain phosphoinositide-interacting protein 2 [Trichonephila clavata]